MAKASSSDVQIQTGQNDEEAEQSPPLITDEGGGTGDQKAENEGCKCNLEDNMCRIDVRNEEERESGSSAEKVCRICHLGCDQLPPGEGNVSLVQLGCSCKGELGVSHYNCAKAWFMHKGNWTCEICGKPAKNIQGVEETGVRAVMRPEVRVIRATTIAINSSSYERHPGCGTGNFFCNFLLAAMILAFLLPWLFHPSRL